MFLDYNSFLDTDTDWKFFSERCSSECGAFITSIDTFTECDGESMIFTTQMQIRILIMGIQLLP